MKLLDALFPAPGAALPDLSYNEMSRAILGGDADRVAQLLEADSSLAAAEDPAILGNPLHVAARCMTPRAVEILERLLAAAPEAALQKDYFGCLPLHYAGKWRNTAALHLLIAAAPETLHVAGMLACLPIHCAAAGMRGHISLFEKVFLRRQPAADFDTTVADSICLLLAAAPETALALDDQSNTPLNWAAMSDSPAAAAALLAAEPALARVALNAGSSPLFMAAAQGNVRTLAVLIPAAPEMIHACGGNGSCRWQQRCCWPPRTPPRHSGRTVWPPRGC